MYSSVVVFTAIWARLFLNKKITDSQVSILHFISDIFPQWIGIIMVTAGLAISAIGGTTPHSKPDDKIIQGKPSFSVDLELIFSQKPLLLKPH